jgi:hypothetical protein
MKKLEGLRGESMSVILKLSADAEAALRRQAAADGCLLEEYLAHLLEDQAGTPRNGQAATGEELLGEGERPWRGVLKLARPKSPLETGRLHLPAGPLPRRAPTASMHWQRVRPDDE